MNPYSVNRMTLAAGVGALSDEGYTRSNCAAIIENRRYTQKALAVLGFEQTDSRANFIFAKHPRVGGEKLYLGLKQRGVLVRHFAAPRISDYIRVTIGTKTQMDAFLNAVRSILEEENA